MALYLEVTRPEPILQLILTQPDLLGAIHHSQQVKSSACSNCGSLDACQLPLTCLVPQGAERPPGVRLAGSPNVPVEPSKPVTPPVWTWHPTPWFTAVCDFDASTKSSMPDGKIHSTGLSQDWSDLDWSRAWQQLRFCFFHLIWSLHKGDHMPHTPLLARTLIMIDVGGVGSALASWYDCFHSSPEMGPLTPPWSSHKGICFLLHGNA